jgi:hypothetical protein
MHVAADAVTRRRNRIIMSTFGQSRWAYFIAQKYALIALRWMLSRVRNRCWNSVKCLLGVLPLRCTATIVHFVMDQLMFFGSAVSGDKLFLYADITLCNAARSHPPRCDVTRCSTAVGCCRCCVRDLLISHKAQSLRSMLSRWSLYPCCGMLSRWSLYPCVTCCGLFLISERWRSRTEDHRSGVAQ